MSRHGTAGLATHISDALPISAHILTWNSAATLESALKSVEDCREILVIDGGSTDDTLAIAKRYGAKIIQQRPPSDQQKPLSDFAEARNIALQAATEPWILTLDSDEQLSWGLQEDLHRIARAEREPAAYLIPRRYLLPDGTPVDFASTYPNQRLYFFHRDAVEQWIKPVHERPQLKPGTIIRTLKNGTLAPLGPPEDFYEKAARYLAIEAAQSHGKGWWHWLHSRVWHTCRSRLIAAVRLAGIWLLPHKGTRLPFAYERSRFWYAWKLIVVTCPLVNR